MGAERGGRTAAGVAGLGAALASAVVLAGPVHGSDPYDLSSAGSVAQDDPCAIPPGGEAPLMCQSGVAPVAAAPAPADGPDGRAGAVAALGATVVGAGAGVVVLVRRRRSSAVA